MVAVTLRPPPSRPIEEAEHLIEHHANQNGAKDEDDQRGREVPCREGHSDAACVLCGQDQDADRQHHPDDEPQKSPVPTNTRSLVAARAVVGGPAVASGDRTARSLTSLEVVVDRVIELASHRLRDLARKGTGGRRGG